MSVSSSTKKSPSSKSGRSTEPNVTPKKLFRHAWEYAQKIESTTKATKHAIDLFKPELRGLRRKLKEKCCKVLVQDETYSRKAEELLWKRGFYDVVQRCKLQKEALDVTTPLGQAYSRHLSSAITFYEHLHHKLQHRYDPAIHESGDKDSRQWLKDAMYRGLIHQGDLARYQVSFGGDSRAAVAYYHKAITLDPSNGTAFNQLAVLVKDKNDGLDSIYYYQRSIVSAQPFSGSETNMVALFEKSHQALEHFQSRLIHTTNQDMREVTKRQFFFQFIQLQHALYPGSSGTGMAQDKPLPALCEQTIESFKECLAYDLQSFQESVEERVKGILSGRESYRGNCESVLLPPDLLLKITALSILPSHSLRQLGSTLTPVATAFALSIFSQLLNHSFQCITQLVVSALAAKDRKSQPEPEPMPASKQEEVVESMERGKSIVSLLLEHEVFVDVADEMEGEVEQSEKAESSQISEKNGVCPSTSVSDASVGVREPKQKKKSKKKIKMVDRRRRRKRGPQRVSSEEEEESDSDSDSNRSPRATGRAGADSSDEEDLSLLSDDMDDLDLLESLSESSSSESEEEDGVKPDTPGATTSVSTTDSTKATVKKPGKRQFILAVNFPDAFPQKEEFQNEGGEVVREKDQEQSIGAVTNKASSSLAPLFSDASAMSHDKIEDDSQLGLLLQSTAFQSAVHTACSMAAEDSTLMALRLFTYWLQSYPIIIATCTQSSATMWSRIACLLNVLPTMQDITTSDIAGFVVAEENRPLVEDLLLREFPPISPAQQTLRFNEVEPLSAIQETSCRVYSLQGFGHFLAENRTAPSFVYDKFSKKFEGPQQKTQREQDIAKANEEEEKKQAAINRSKLMKAMAQQRLQSEVKTLSEASSKTGDVVFTPYLIPDASSLCSGLHIVKKLVKTEKFVFIIAKAVIESLDNMKKGQQSYTAREAIKFLEKELHSGNKFIQAQKPTESLNPGKRKPPKIDLQDWLFECLVDCACYFNQTYAEKGHSRAVVTLIVEKRILDIFSDLTKQADNQHLAADTLMTAQQNGVDIETIIGFHINWSKNMKKRTQS